MKSYRVTLTASAFAYVTVEAENEEDAVEAAFDEGPGSICAKCSGWGESWGVELGEWDFHEPDGSSIEELPL